MFGSNEVILRSTTVPLFNVLKYVLTSVVFGSVLDFAAESIDSALARRELVTRGWTRFRQNYVPRIARSGLSGEVSIRSAIALLIILLALASDVLSELSYVARDVSISIDQSPRSYVIVRNGTVSRHPLFGTTKDLAVSDGISCLGSLQGRSYIDRTLIVSYSESINLSSNETGFRKHFKIGCGNDLAPNRKNYPVVVKQSDEEAREWILAAGARVVESIENGTVGLPYMGDLRLEYVERLMNRSSFDNSDTTVTTDMFDVVFPRMTLLCTAPALQDSRIFNAICWNQRRHVYRILFNIPKINRKKLIHDRVVNFTEDEAQFDGEILVKGITSLEEFRSFSVLYVALAGNRVKDYVNTLFAARLTVLLLKHSYEFAGKEETSVKAIRPVVRMRYFLPSVIIVLISGVCGAFFIFTNKTMPIFRPEQLAASWCCHRMDHVEEFQQQLPRKAYLVVKEREVLERSDLYVSVDTDLKIVEKPDSDRAILGLSHSSIEDDLDLARIFRNHFVSFLKRFATFERR